MKENVSLVYFCIGNQDLLIKKTVFSILSFWSFHSKECGIDIVLFTDDIDTFRPYLENYTVRYELLTSTDISAMRGKIDFVHRVKIGVIERFFQLYKSNAIYVDADTFFYGNIQHLLPHISREESIMHLPEYSVKTLENFDIGDPHRQFYQVISDNYFTLAGSAQKLPTDFISWNAGVIGLHRENAYLLAQVYELTEQFYPLSKSHASEQYAFSYVLQTNTIIFPAQDVVYHYWHRVHKSIADIYFGALFKKSKERQAGEVKKLIGQLPGIFHSHRLQMEYLCLTGFWNKDYRNAYRYLLKAIMKGSLFQYTFLREALFGIRQHLLFLARK